jgi:hypothetical protein
MELPRPMTHDLFINVLAETGWTLAGVTVTKLQEKTFYAELTLTDIEGNTKIIDSRPSDSIALALRAGAKIQVAQKVLDEAGGTSHEQPEEGAEEAEEAEEAQPSIPIVDANTDLEDVDPELFSKYKM